MAFFFELTNDERGEWLRHPVTQAYLAHLLKIGQSFQQDALGRARQHQPAAYETGKADGIDDAIRIANGDE